VGLDVWGFQVFPLPSLPGNDPIGAERPLSPEAEEVEEVPRPPSPDSPPRYASGLEGEIQRRAQEIAQIQVQWYTFSIFLALIHLRNSGRAAEAGPGDSEDPSTIVQYAIYIGCYPPGHGPQ